jgi:hypothetical protein
VNSDTNMNSSSKTNWERIDGLTDEKIDVSDAPPQTDEFFATAKWLIPGKSASHQTVKVSLEEDTP